jgi:lipopolysaccharide export system protein LptC
MAEVLAPLSASTRGPVRQRQPFVWRLQSWLGSYLPLAVMALLAAGTTWLVKISPGPEGPTQALPPRQTPDYTMQGFELQRFNAQGEGEAWIKGLELRHYPATDSIQIDQVHVRARNAAGEWLLAQADRAEGPRDGSQLLLKGNVKMSRHPAGNDPEATTPDLTLEAKALEANLKDKRVRSRDEATARTATGTTVQMQGFDYDHAKGLLRIGGPSTTTIAPKASSTKAAPTRRS